MNHENIISGLAFTGTGFTPESVEIVISEGIIREITPVKNAGKYLILPKFFNAHTHLADTVAMDTPVDRPLAELVAPPNGLKHRILRETPDSMLEKAMRESIGFMEQNGTAGFADFREGGEAGVRLLQAAAADCKMQHLIFGRDGGEKTADGCGLSSAHGTAEEEKLRDEMKKAGKPFAVHVAEKGTDDIEDAFALEPDFMVHAVHFRHEDIRRAADLQVPIVLCPRSNWKLHVASKTTTPPVREMLDAGCRLFLGTDNVMFVSPDMFAECAFLHTVYEVSSIEVLRMAVSGAELAGKSCFIEEGNDACLNVIDIGYAKDWSKDAVASVFSRGHRLIP